MEAIVDLTERLAKRQVSCSSSPSLIDHPPYTTLHDPGSLMPAGAETVT